MLTDSCICALDIGTTKVCAILGNFHQETIIAAVSSPARGVSQGVVVNTDDLTDVIVDVITKLEEKTGIRVRDVYTNITGIHIESKNTKGKIVISEQGGGITAYDINKAINFAENIGLSLERRIIQAIVQDYTVDGQGGIANPINLYGQELEVNLHIISGSREQIEKLSNSICCAGLNIRELVPSAIASSMGVLTEEEKKSGVLMMDIGEGVIDLATFKEGVVKSVRVIPLKGLELDKLLPLTKENKSSEHFSVVITGGYTFTDQLQKRIGRIEQILSVPARIGMPHSQHSDIPNLHSPAYATTLGLIRYGFDKEKQQKMSSALFCNAFTRFASRVKKTFSTYF